MKTHHTPHTPPQKRSKGTICQIGCIQACGEGGTNAHTKGNWKIPLVQLSRRWTTVNPLNAIATQQTEPTAKTMKKCQTIPQVHGNARTSTGSSQNVPRQWICARPQHQPEPILICMAAQSDESHRLLDQASPSFPSQEHQEGVLDLIPSHVRIMHMQGMLLQGCVS
ncbi:hypothetical protein ACHAW6_009322 [Cyclotella cf. meneghiniana]